MAQVEQIDSSPVQEEVFLVLHLTKAEAHILRALFGQNIAINNGCPVGRAAQSLYDALDSVIPLASRVSDCFVLEPGLSRTTLRTNTAITSEQLT